MRLELLTPPALVAVDDLDGTTCPALLLARRGERRYVQVSRGAGLNHLRWLDAAAVSEAAVAPVTAPVTPTWVGRRPR